MNREDIEKYQKIEGIIQDHKDQLAAKKAEFENQNIDLIETIRIMSAEQENLKNQIKDQAIEEFNETNVKKLLGGIGIREGTNLKYDEKAAFDWAKDHKLCLQLDKKEFEKIAKTQDIEFVKKESKITVTFPKEIKFEDAQ